MDKVRCTDMKHPAKINAEGETKIVPSIQGSNHEIAEESVQQLIACLPGYDFESKLTDDQTEYGSVMNLGFVLDLDGFMKLHDLTGWLKQISERIMNHLVRKHDMVGSMKLRDLKGWLKRFYILI